MSGSGDDLQLFVQTSNKRGIPEAIFIENVEASCKRFECNKILNSLQELYSKYQYMQSSLVAQRSALKSKLPDISSALETVNHLIERRNKATEGDTAEYTYQLSENIWSRASVAPTNNVCLWLGANIMLEYTLDEALELLQTNEQNAKTTIVTLDEDMAFLRDQITTTEVNIARTHNYNVKQRQHAKEGEAASQPAQPVPSSAPKAIAAVETPSADGSYSWKQESEEVEVTIPLPKDAVKKDVTVTILAESLRVEHLGKLLLQGDLAGRCSPNGSTWTLNNGRVEISLEKADSVPWPSLFAEEV
jgi:prefoldin subunit 5